MIVVGEEENEPLLNPLVPHTAQDGILKEEDIQAWPTRIIGTVKRFAHLRSIFLLLFLDSAMTYAAPASTLTFARALACEDYYASNPQHIHLLAQNGHAYQSLDLVQEANSPRQLCAIPEVESRVAWLITTVSMIQMLSCLVMMALVYGNLLPIVSRRLLLGVALLGQALGPLFYATVPHSYPYGPVYGNPQDTAVIGQKAAWCSPRVSLCLLVVTGAAVGSLGSDDLASTIGACLIVDSTPPEARSQALALARAAPVIGLMVWSPVAQLIAQKLPIYAFRDPEHEASSLNVSPFVLAITVAFLVLLLLVFVLKDRPRAQEQQSESGTAPKITVWTTLRAVQPYKDHSTGRLNFKMPILAIITVLTSIGSSVADPLVIFLGYVGASQELVSLVIAGLGGSLLLGLCIVIPTLDLVLGKLYDRPQPASSNTCCLTVREADAAVEEERPPTDAARQLCTLCKAEQIDLGLLRIGCASEVFSWLTLTFSASWLWLPGIFAGISLQSFNPIRQALISSLAVSWTTRRQAESKKAEEERQASAEFNAHPEATETQPLLAPTEQVPTTDNVIACLSLATILGLVIGPLVASGTYSALLPTGQAALTLLWGVVAYLAALLMTIGFRR